MASKNKLLAQLGNTKTRTVVLFFGVVFIIVVGVALSRFSNSDDPLAQKASQTIAVPDNIQAIPGNKTPEKYRELQLADNKIRVEEARKSATSAIPTIIHSDQVKDTSNFGIKNIHGYGPYGPYGVGPDGKPFGLGPDGKPYDPNGPYGPNGAEFNKYQNNPGYSIHGFGPNGPYGVGPDGKPFGLGPDGKPYDPNGPYAPDWYKSEKQSPIQSAKDQASKDREAADRARQERQARAEANRNDAAQQKLRALSEQKVQEKSGLMDAQAKALFQSWASYPLQFYAAAAEDKSVNGALGATTFDANGPTNLAFAGGPLEMIKTGSILFAVIDTAVNSDVPGPILATVVHGPYKGARLIGEFAPPTPASEGLSLKFSKM